MQITRFRTPDALNTAGADFMLNHLAGGQSRLLCPATGSSATGIYNMFVSKNKAAKTINLRVIKLDEWASLPMDHPGSCEYYINEHLLQPLKISKLNYISFNSKAGNPNAECERIAGELDTNGPIDLCVLGLGLNGHIAFNEPANELQPGVHLAKLSESSMAHPMMQDVPEKPTRGYTLGLANILQSKTILLVVQGKHKKKIFQQLLEQKINTNLPASFLWLHNNSHCYYCED